MCALGDTRLAHDVKEFGEVTSGGGCRRLMTVVEWNASVESLITRMISSLFIKPKHKQLISK